MAEIVKKCWPESFKELEMGKKFELRLADFELKKGDTLLLKEWNPQNRQFTGKQIKRKVKALVKSKPTEYYAPEAIEEHGLYLIELE